MTYDASIISYNQILFERLFLRPHLTDILSVRVPFLCFDCGRRAHWQKSRGGCRKGRRENQKGIQPMKNKKKIFDYYIEADTAVTFALDTGDERQQV